MDVSPVTTLTQQYIAQFSSTADTVRQRATSLVADAQQNLDPQQLRAKIEQKVQQMQQQVVDVAPLLSTDFSGRLMPLLVRAGVCLIVVSIGHLLGGVILAKLLSFIVAPFPAAITAVFIIPIVFMLWLNDASTQSVDDRGMWLMLASLLMGVFNGFALAEFYLTFWAPPTFLVPLFAGIVIGVAGPSMAGNRATLLGAAIGLPVIIELLWGFISGSISFGYITLVILTAVLLIAGLQIAIADPNVESVQMSACLVAGALLAVLLVTVMFGTDYEGYQKIMAQSQQ